MKARNVNTGERVFQNTEHSGPGATPTPSTQLLALIGFVGLCLLVLITDGAMASRGLHGWYLSLTQPPGTLPRWQAIWAVLYLFVGGAAWQVWRLSHADTRRALRLWGWQLLLNAAWTPAFFGLHSPALGAVVLLPLLLLTAATIRAFAPLLPIAAGLMLPYAAWTCYVTYLNLGFLWLNHS